jgi:FtsZ-binding cell division protein ZapB
MKESAAISDDFTQLKEENAQLRETIHDIKIERRQLKERLDALTQDKSASRSSQILRERNNVLKEEVEKLTKRLKKMEASITRFAI